MTRLLFPLVLLFLSALVPAQAQRALPGLVEGTQYRYIEDGQPWHATPPGMVEVTEVFAYTCPHCAQFAPMLDKWVPTLPAQARFVLLPGVYGRDDAWARAFFAAQDTRSLPVLHPRLFAALHETGELPNNATAAQIAGFAAKVQGVNGPAFAAAIRDDAKLLPRLQRAYEFAARSGIEGTPSLVINGRYLVLGNSYESLLGNARAIVDALAPRKASPSPTAKPGAKPAARPAVKPAATRAATSTTRSAT